MAERSASGPGQGPENGGFTFGGFTFNGPDFRPGMPKRVRRCQGRQAVLGLQRYLESLGARLETAEDLLKRGWSRKSVHVHLERYAMNIYGLGHLYPADRAREAEHSPEVRREILRTLESRRPPGEKPQTHQEGAAAPGSRKPPGEKRAARRETAAPANPALPRREWENIVITGHHRNMFPGMDDYAIRDTLAERMDPDYRPPGAGEKPGPGEKPGDGKRKEQRAGGRFRGNFARMASARPEGGGPLWNRGGRG